MSAAATQQQPPVIPPRPSRSQDREQAASMPAVPPRPINRRVNRSISPNPDRFAPSPLNETLLSKSPNSVRFGGLNVHGIDSADRHGSVDIPSVGEEGKEYEALAEELNSSRSVSPEQTRTIGDDIKLHAPKPSLPASSAKQRVMAVTRTDSDRAASFGIGKPSSDDVTPSNRSLKKKASTTSQLSNSDKQFDDNGIPEIGQQVPMLRDAGDVQAPSPAPSETVRKHHARKSSSRGLPPGSYGLHGHGVAPQDKLEKAYFEKHPDLLKKEHTPHHHDRPNDFSMSSDDLNKIVYETSRRGSGVGTRNGAVATPSEQVEWQAYEEATSRITSPRPPSTKPQETSQPNITISEPRRSQSSSISGEEKIHVDEPNRRRSVMFSDDEAIEDAEEHPYTAPILADDELAKEGPQPDSQPAVEPPPERRGSAFEMDRPHSRPTSRPASIYRVESTNSQSTPLEDVQEYEPLFPEEESSEKKKIAAIAKKESKHRFPSADVWEDAPNSVLYTAEVSTPELPEEKAKEELLEKPLDVREGETAAQAFARRQEELAEQESQNTESFLRRSQRPTSWVPLTAAVPKESRPYLAPRFPSRDVWEDTPDSLKLETTVSTPQLEQESSPAETTHPEIPAKAAQKPAIPGRPKPKASSPQETTKPAVPERPKPHVPARPARTSPSEEAPAPKPKPAVPARPLGSKIAALQAGFMSDLNKRLQLGPQAPKKEEPVAQDLTEEKEKAPLADARKGRARGPQRRAPPATSPSPAAAPQPQKPTLTFSTTVTVFTIDPDEGSVLVSEDKTEQPLSAPSDGENKTEQEAPKKEATPEEPSQQVPAIQEPATEESGNDASEAAPEEPAVEKTETLATNMAGETIAEAHVEEDEKQHVEPTDADATVVKD